MSDPIAWQKGAACKGKELVLFYGPGEGETRETAEQKENRIKQAKEICAQCPVRAECLDWHLRVSPSQYGVAGGLDEDERKAYRRRERRRKRDGRQAS